MKAFAVALAAVVVAAGGGSATAGYPGKNGRIAFVRSVSAATASGLPLVGLPAIHTIRPDGTGLRRLLDDPAYDGEPAWSPDGARLAFVRGAPPTGDVHVVEADGSNRRLLVSSVTRGVSWSPDGSRLAFTRGNRIWTVELESLRVRPVTATPGERPAWSPNGRWIAYFRGGSDVAELVHPNGTGRRVLGRFPYYGDSLGKEEELAWTPSGRLTAVARYGLLTMDALGKRRRQETYRFGIDPAWSPDGKWVAVNVVDRVAGDDFRLRLELFAAGRSRTRTLTPALERTTDADPSWQPLCTRSGGPGRDTLTGTRQLDVLCGLGGGDVIRGGRGADRLFGGDGDDTLFSRDGAFDVVGCGAGRDVVVADRRDLVGVDCEVVRRPRR